MKERPIIMGAESVRAILGGRKTQTRRAVKHIPALGWVEDWCRRIDNADFKHIVGDYRRFCPYGKVGDRLWVREAWATLTYHEGDVPIHIVKDNKNIENDVVYYAECPDFSWLDGDGFQEYRKDGMEASHWKSPIHMPRWASRITLEITDIRVERVQDIGVQDAKDEGIRVHANGCKDGLAYGCYNGDNCVKNVCRQPIEYYKQLWDSLNAKRGYPWESNPWVWVITFKVV